MSIFDGKLTIQATAASGTEAVLKRELTALGYSPEGARYGRIEFGGNMLDVARSNVFLRTAGRIRVVVARFDAETFDELFDKTAAVEWQHVFPADAKITISAKSLKSKLFSLSDIQRIVKKAIAVSMCRAGYGNTLSESGTEYRLEVSLIDDVATLSVDTSGDGLHKRGYRTYLGEAPIRETLAAAIILLSVWKADRAFADPFCGSGTLAIEAALIGTNTAPGINRAFAFESFPNAPAVAETARDEARQLVDADAKLRIRGSDVNPEAVKLASRHAERAGMSRYVHFQTDDMRNFSSRFSHGVIVTNPPYGERLMKERELKELYRDFGNVFSRLDEWSAYVITSFFGFEKYFGRRADKTRKLYNSEIECTLYRFLGAPPARKITRDDESDRR